MKLVSSVALVIVLGSAFAGCGESDADRAAAEAKASESAAAAASASAEASASAAAEAKREAEEREWRKCKSQTQGLLSTLEEIDSRLDVGLSYDELGDRLGDASVAYNRINFKAMESKCTLNVGIALEDGYNQYAKSLGKWEKCINDYYCTVEGAVLQGLRKHWSEASERIAHAEKVLSSSDRYAKATDFGV